MNNVTLFAVATALTLSVSAGCNSEDEVTKTCNASCSKNVSNSHPCKDKQGECVDKCIARAAQVAAQSDYGGRCGLCFARLFNFAALVCSDDRTQLCEQGGLSDPKCTPKPNCADTDQICNGVYQGPSKLTHEVCVNDCIEPDAGVAFGY
ncbi:MAG: hypothetical protein H6707_03085 [Deltaproteobacteria bacterium]|nr:hypothetical protein [Deltaproteobacteria bacterium]